MSTLVSNGLDLANARIERVGDPQGPTDAANRQWVENFVAGLNWKPAVKAASTGNVTLTAPLTTLDGVSLQTNDRVLIKDQTDQKVNGIYVVPASGAMQRAADADTAAELRSLTVSVEQGTVNADTIWVQTADNITLGTTNLVFAQFKAGITYTSGNGILITGTSIAVVPAPSGGLTVGASGVGVDTALIPRMFEIIVGDGTATSFVIAHGFGRKAQIAVYDLSSNPSRKMLDDSDMAETTPFNFTTRFAVAPAANSKRVVVQG